MNVSNLPFVDGVDNPVDVLRFNNTLMNSYLIYIYKISRDLIFLQLNLVEVLINLVLFKSTYDNCLLIPMIIDLLKFEKWIKMKIMISNLNIICW